MKTNAYAKINICLNVKGKREDGYHELEMIMVPITLHDVVTLTLEKQDCYTSNDCTIPMDASNTVVKAVELMRTTYALKQHFHIHVEKHIPAQAGLAGGSADGAAVLRLINDVCELARPLEELAQLGKQIGADVPFCVMQRCALVSGIGEKISPFSVNCEFDILLVKPAEGVSTGKAFSMLDYEACDHPDCEQVRVCLEQDAFSQLSSICTNSLENSAFKLVPSIENIKKELVSIGFSVALMSGSGSCIFGFTRDQKLLQDTAKKMQEKGYWVYKTNIILDENQA